MYLFFVRDFNDIDHITPIVWKMKGDNYPVAVYCINPEYDIQSDYRLNYLKELGVEVDFIYDTTHPDYREGYDHKGTKVWAEKSEWHGLEIISTTDGGPKDDKGEVEFIARFRDKDGVRSHHERGQFARKRKKWLFTEGIMVKSQPLSVTKIGRNDPCSCGSGKKYKKCCDSSTLH